MLLTVVRKRKEFSRIDEFSLLLNSNDLVKELCDAIERCKILKALRLEGNTINEEAAKEIGKAVSKHPEIEVNSFPVCSE